jgi:hypothetical protein
VAALYKGFVPKVLRLAPGGGVLLLVVEFTLGIFRTGIVIVYRCYSVIGLLIGRTLCSTWAPVYLENVGEACIYLQKTKLLICIEILCGSYEIFAIPNRSGLLGVPISV